MSKEERKPKLVGREFSPEVFKENLAQVRENLKGIREAFADVFFPNRPRILKRLREKRERLSEPEVIVVEREAPRDYTKAKEYAESRRVYESITRSPTRERLKKSYVKPEYVEPEVEEEVEHRPQKKEFRGLGVRDFLRTLFEQSSEQVKLRTEHEKLRLEKERKRLEKEEKEKKVEGHSGLHY